MDKRIPMTLAGYNRVTAELERMKNEDRPAILTEIEKASSEEGFSSARYLDALEKEDFLSGWILDYEYALSHAQVIDPKNLSGNKVVFGATVDVSDFWTGKKLTYQIVGQLEADLEKGRLSHISPLAKALLGKSKGNVVEVQTRKGTEKYKIMAIRFV